jgi:glycosyltransferase involved in cell wall biosynthesis
MKIGFDGKRALHNLRGLGNYSRTLIESLDIHFPENEYLLFSSPVKNEELSSWYESLSKQTKVIGPNSNLLKKFPSIWRSLLLNKDLQSFDLDVYHGLSHEIPPGVNKSNFLKVVTIHDLLYLKFPKNFSFIDRNVYHRKFHHSVREADIVVAICEQTKRDIIEYLHVPEEKIHVIYQSCSPQFYEEASLEEKSRVKEKHQLDKDYVFHIAAMEPNKNQLSIVKAFEKIKDEVEENLVLAGRGGDYKQKVKDYIKEKGLSSRVKVLEDVPMTDLPALYQMATLFVFPSFYEGFGIPIIEAQFSKTPVITSLGSCFPESGGPAAKYIDPHTISDISNSMLEVLGDKELQKEMAQKGHEFVQKFHWKNTSKNLIDLYSTHL